MTTFVAATHSQRHKSSTPIKFNIRNLIVPLGQIRSVLLISFISTLSSIILTLLITVLTGNINREELFIALSYGTALPLIISSVVSWPIVKIVLRLDKLETEMRYLASYDGLTKVLNRRAFLEKADYLLQVAKRQRLSFSVVLADIDNFKRINDQFGHEAGDDVLQQVGSLFNSCIRESDLIGRYGGEEFVLLFTTPDPTKAVNACERLHKQLRQLVVPFKGHSIQVTISIGVAHFKPTTDISLQELLSQADQAMYHAKNNGKDQTIVFAN